MNIIHIGLPKSASTTLQDNLFTAQQKFLYLGPVDNKFADPRKEDLIWTISFQDSLDYDALRSKSLLDELRQDSRPLLVSNEGFSLEGGADRHLMAQRLHALFAPAKVLLVLRAQPALCQSHFVMQVRAAGESIASFDEWFAGNYGSIYSRDRFRIGLDYEPLVRMYEDLFGADNVVVLPLELVGEANSRFTETLAELFDMPASAVHGLLTQNVANQRMSQRNLLAVQMQNYLPKGTNLALLGRRWLPRPVYDRIRGFVVSGRRVDYPDVPAAWNAQIFEMCARGNARLAARKNLPLRDLGYPVADAV